MMNPSRSIFLNHVICRFENRRVRTIKDLITGELDMGEPERKKFVRRVTVYAEQP